MSVQQSIEVGTKIAFRVIALILGLIFLYLISDIIVLTFLAIIVSVALNPIIHWFQRRKLPRTISVIIVYLSVLAFFGSFVALLVPPFINQIGDFVNNFPNYVDKVLQLGNVFGGQNTMSVDSVMKSFEENVVQSFSGIFSTTIGVLSGFVSFIVFFFLSLYMSLEENGIEKFFSAIVPSQYQKYSASFARRAQAKIGQWLLGQFILMFVIFLLYYIGLSILHVPYALLLALLGGALEIVPYVGPILASIPAILMGFLEAPLLGMSVLIFYVVAHQIESHAVAPQVMKRAVGVNPVVVILSLLIGAKLGGLLGVILAVPAAAVFGIFVEDFLEKKNAE